MSLAVAIEAANGIVLAADSRATFGDPRGMTTVNDTVQKIFQLTPRTVIALVGAAETGAALIGRMTPNFLANPSSDADSVSETVRTTSNQLFSQWFGQPTLVGMAGPMPNIRPEVLFVLVGYNAANQPRIITLGSSAPFNFSPNLATTGFATAGVVPLAVYLLNRLYERGMDLEIAKDLAAYCIQETASQDGKVGGPIRMAVVRPGDNVVLIGSEEVTRITARADRHRETLKRSFLQVAQPETVQSPEAAPARSGEAAKPLNQKL